eukprot:m.107246 g.107246  ORF g.107246 m.107246 type:complete len:60 (+) comp13919_c0_seq1:3899-4078(+)
MGEVLVPPAAGVAEEEAGEAQEAADVADVHEAEVAEDEVLHPLHNNTLHFIYCHKEECF